MIFILISMVCVFLLPFLFTYILLLSYSIYKHLLHIFFILYIHINHSNVLTLKKIHIAEIIKRSKIIFPTILVKIKGNKLIALLAFFIDAISVFISKILKTNIQANRVISRGVYYEVIINFWYCHWAYSSNWPSELFWNLKI